MPCVANIHYEIPFVKGCGVFYKKMILGVSLRKTGDETFNCLQYIKTKFFRALLSFNRISIHIIQKTFDFIPLQDFTEEWTDEKLYKKYGLTREEIDFIEGMIRPME